MPQCNQHILPIMFEILHMYLYYWILLQLSVKQNSVIPNNTSGAKHFTIYIMSANCIYYIVHVFEKHEKMKHVLPA